MSDCASCSEMRYGLILSEGALMNMFIRSQAALR